MSAAMKVYLAVLAIAAIVALVLVALDPIPFFAPSSPLY